jgi:integrase
MGTEEGRMARRTLGRLSARQVATCQPARGRDVGYLADGGNLILQCRRGDDSHVTRSWIFRYERSGRRHDLGLGPCHSVSLATARTRARDLREQLYGGTDPLAARRAQRQAMAAELAKRVTFKQCATEYIAAHAGSWRHPKHASQWPSSLRKYAYPVLGELAVSEIEVAHVLRCLEGIWNRIPETASRVRARIEVVLGFATVRGYRSGDNPAQWRGRIATLLPSKRKVRAVQHFRALAYAETPAFVAALRSRPDVAARGLEFLILTACRTGELVGMVWDEVDTKAKTWTIPGARTKSRRTHRTPLSSAAMAILAGMPRRGDRVFPIGEGALRDVMQRLKADGTPHGFRAAFRTWCAERTGFAHEICEQALAHQIPDAVVRSYKRTDLFDRRRALMEQWSAFLAKPLPAAATVTPIRAAQ